METIHILAIAFASVLVFLAGYVFGKLSSKEKYLAIGWQNGFFDRLAHWQINKMRPRRDVLGRFSQENAPRDLQFRNGGAL
jgi:hypothetical protein